MSWTIDWSCWLRCKFYKDGDNLPLRLNIISLCIGANLTYMNCSEWTILMHFLLRNHEDDYTRDRPSDLTIFFYNNGQIKDTSKGTLA